jgi:homoserine acetyltransferase
VILEGDGTIRSRDALVWFSQQSALEAERAEVAETWWSIRSNILGGPHGSRSSLFVNQHTGVHMRKILEAMNASGMFGPIKESSLEMLSPKTHDNQ